MSDHKLPFPLNPVIEAYKKDVDRSLLRQNLRLTPTERLQKLMEMQAWAIELRNAGNPKSLRATKGFRQKTTQPPESPVQTVIKLSIPESILQKARFEADATGQSLEDVLITTLADTYTPYAVHPDGA
jgi:hypothetical protein